MTKLVNPEPIIKKLADRCLVAKGLECSVLGSVIDMLRAAPAVNDVPYWATERAYKNGYEKGYEDGDRKSKGAYVDGLLDGRRNTLNWIPVTESLPKDSTYVLVRLSGGAIYEALCLSSRSKQWYAINREPFVNKETVTHWMPLPEPPKEEIKNA